MTVSVKKGRIRDIPDRPVPLAQKDHPLLTHSPLADDIARPLPRKSTFPPPRAPAGSSSLADLETAYHCLKLEIAQFVQSSKIHESRIRDMLEGMSGADINNLRYRIFAPHYDEHMKSHERALELLIRQAILLESVAFPFGPKLINDRILEMSCGTGTVIKLLSEALPPVRTARLRFTANDLSEDMKELAREKVKGLQCKVGFSSQEIGSMAFRSRFGTIILSQTLHLLTDPDVVRQERSSNYMYLDEKRHVSEKFRAIQNAWSLLEPNGTLVIIDEWPALLSDRGGPLGAGFAYLFNDSLRGIDWLTFQNSIMSHMHGSRFVAQLKVPIDSKHKMHLVVYRKDPGKTEKARKLPPGGKFEQARRSAVDTLIRSFRSIDSHFIHSLMPANGEEPLLRFLPMGLGTTLQVGRSGYAGNDGCFDEVHIIRSIHTQSTAQRTRVISEAINSLRPGGSLLLIEEWPAPTKRSIGKSMLKSGYMDLFAKHIFFAGALRVPISPPYTSGMYGYLYRKVF
ncbi:MAG: class I SAM-dependent methyltransferase [Candidatus Micrarchaeia archaeon]